MEFWLKQIKKFVYIISFGVAIGVYLYVRHAFASSTLQQIRLTEVYGLLAVACLYLALLPGPLYSAFRSLPGRPVYIKARPALGIAAFGFGLLHSFTAFTSLLRGLNGLGFLSTRYQIDISLSFIALLILCAMALTSNGYAIKKLGRWWKFIHRFVFLAGILIIIHVLALGSHFVDLSRAIPQIFFYALFIFLLLQGLRLDSWFNERFGVQVRFGPIFVVIVFFLALFGAVVLLGHGSVFPFSFHQH